MHGVHLARTPHNIRTRQQGFAAVNNARDCMMTGSIKNTNDNTAWLKLLGHPVTLAITAVVMDRYGCNYRYGNDSITRMTSYLQL